MESIYDYIGDSIRIRSKCKWYRPGGKIDKVLFQPQKKVKRRIQEIILEEKERNGQKVISNNIKKKIMKHSLDKTPQKIMLKTKNSIIM